MDTNAPKTPATLPFAGWQSLSARAAAREVHRRIAALPENLRTAALAWIRPERELAEELSLSPRENSPLHGVPYLLKDLFDLARVPTNAGSTFLNQARGTPAADSNLVKQLHAHGAACAGKTHLVEFAAGLYGDNAHYGDCPHPHFADRLSGGSSSGSAALIGTGVVPFAIGTDTGGSVRVPAAFCGVYGFRLTPNDLFIRDAVPLAPTLDTAGWFAGSATDLLTANSAILGNSSARATQSPRGAFISAKNFGVPFAPEVEVAYERAAARLAPALDAAARDAFFTSWQNAISAYTVIALSEAHAYHRDWLVPYRAHYEPSIWQRFTDGGNYSAAQIAEARAILENVRAVFRTFFQTHDFLILPATPFPALRKIDCTPEARKALLTLTVPASLAGLPVLTIPLALPDGLSSGLQVIVPTATSAAIANLLKSE